jgi:Exonuclease
VLAPGIIPGVYVADNAGFVRNCVRQPVCPSPMVRVLNFYRSVLLGKLVWLRAQARSSVYLSVRHRVSVVNKDGHVLLDKFVCPKDRVTVCLSVRPSVRHRVCVVNNDGHVLLDKFVRPKERVTDYRTRFSGVRPADLKATPTFEEVRSEVEALFDGRILVGHAIINDLKVPLAGLSTGCYELGFGLFVGASEHWYRWELAQPP